MRVSFKHVIRTICIQPHLLQFCSTILYYQAWSYSGSCTGLVAGFMQKGELCIFLIITSQSMPPVFWEPFSATFEYSTGWLLLRKLSYR